MPIKPDDATALARPIGDNVAMFPMRQAEPSALRSVGLGGLEPLARDAAVLRQTVPRRGVAAGIAKICERWQLGKNEQIALLGYAGDEFVGAQILAGRARGGQDVRDRVGNLVAIAVGLRALFNNNIPNELRWLHEPRDATDNKSAIAFMLEGKMINLIRVREIVDRERGL